MANNKLQPHIAVHNFQRFSHRSLFSAFELIFLSFSNKFFLTISSTASIRVLEASE